MTIARRVEVRELHDDGVVVDRFRHLRHFWFAPSGRKRSSWESHLHDTCMAALVSVSIVDSDVRAIRSPRMVPDVTHRFLSKDDAHYVIRDL
jgi:hypothetical protein